MGRLTSGSICKFSVDLVFEQLLCILLDLDWLERSHREAFGRQRASLIGRKGDDCVTD